MFGFIPKWKIRDVQRSANVATDWVAHHTKKGMCESDWIKHFQFSLVRILNKDGLLAPP